MRINLEEVEEEEGEEEEKEWQPFANPEYLQSVIHQLVEEVDMSDPAKWLWRW